MTPKPRTTWIAGTLTLAVLVGVVVAAWRPMMERWYAARFADASLPEAVRWNAGDKLIEMGSTAVMDRAVDLLRNHGCRELVDDPAFIVLGDEPWGPDAERCVPLLRQILRRGSADDRDCAGTILIRCGPAGLTAAPELFAAMPLGDEGSAVDMLNVLNMCCRNARKIAGATEALPTLDEFADRYACDVGQIVRALAPLLAHQWLGYRRAAESTLENFCPGGNTWTSLHASVAELLADRFLNPKAKYGDRVKAGSWIAEHRPRRLPMLALSLLARWKPDDTRTECAAATLVVKGVLRESVGLVHETFPAALIEALQAGTTAERIHAARLAALIYETDRIDEVAASLVGACRSTDARVQSACAQALSTAALWRRLSVQGGQAEPTLDGLAADWACDTEKLLGAFKALLSNPDPGTHVLCASILANSLVLGNVRDSLSGDEQAALDAALLTLRTKETPSP